MLTITDIIDFRKKQGVSQIELAQRLGTHQPVISRIESGKVDPSFSFVVKMIYALGGELDIYEK